MDRLVGLMFISTVRNRNLATVSLAILLLMASQVHAVIWYVHPDSALNSIQTALDTCANNDTVLVGPGIYCESIVWPFTDGIKLIAELGPDSTIIEADSTWRVIQISSGVDSTTMIQGFTIQNGHWLGEGAGIYCELNSSPCITGNLITNNHAGLRGGGIGCHNSSPIITNNTITDNTAFYEGAGINCVRSAAMITHNNITNNSTPGLYAGGIKCLHSAPVIDSNTIANNSASASGGGIQCTWSSAVITSNIITGNSVGIRGGGIGVYEDDSTVIIGNTISYNYATYQGGGICCEYFCAPLIRKNAIINNTAAGVHGGGIYCVTYCTPTIDSCSISNNIGSGVCCWFTSSPVLTHNNITKNEGYGVHNNDPTFIVDARNNWWGDATGPYHPTLNPGGLGDSVSDYVDFYPWLTGPGIMDRTIVSPAEEREYLGTTIFSGPLQLPKAKKCRVFDIIGQVVEPITITPGIYFLEINDKIVQKIVKVR